MIKQVKDYIHNIRSRFTKWYVKKGYRFYVNDLTFKHTYICPGWIKPAVFLIEASVYLDEIDKIMGKDDENLPCAPVEEPEPILDELVPKHCPECGDRPDLWAEDISEINIKIYHCGCRKCGYGRVSTNKGFNDAIARWNKFADEFTKVMGDAVVMKGE